MARLCFKILIQQVFVVWGAEGSARGGTGRAGKAFESRRVISPADGPEDVMRTANSLTRGGLLQKTPNARHQAARRRLALVCALLGLALASGLIGAAIRPPGEPAGQATTHPFSYFPTQ